NRWQARGVGSARRKPTRVRPISVRSGAKRTVKGNKEVAKCVAKSSREHVAWSIEVAFPVEATDLVRHCHSTGEAPRLSSDHPRKVVADSGRVVGEKPGKRAETLGTSAIAPPEPREAPRSPENKPPQAPDFRKRID